MFVDGGFWHGNPTRYWQGRSGPYWDTKIASNQARDRRVDSDLRMLGWTAMRMWDFEILRDPIAAAEIIKQRLIGLPSSYGVGPISLAEDA